MGRSKKMAGRKKKFLEIYEKSFGFVSLACENANMGRSTYYRWLDEDSEFRQKCKDIEEANIDYVESKLFSQIREGNTTATIFYLKTKGKNRGYVERQEVTGKDGSDIILPKVTAEDIDELKRINGIE